MWKYWFIHSGNKRDTEKRKNLWQKDVGILILLFVIYFSDLNVVCTINKNQGKKSKTIISIILSHVFALKYVLGVHNKISIKYFQFLLELESEDVSEDTNLRWSPHTVCLAQSQNL